MLKVSFQMEAPVISKQPGIKEGVNIHYCHLFQRELWVLRSLKNWATYLGV